MTFDNLLLDPKILKALAKTGYTTPTEIQNKAIPEILKGLDIRASAQTGTGKTAAFLLPALNRLLVPSPIAGKGPRVLILAPTRELAMQIATQAEKYSEFLHQVKTVCIGGGVPYHDQLRKLGRPFEILIATPGRLIDFMEQRKIDLSRIEMLVLDEADRMLDMGFVDPVKQIVAATPATRQTLMFSATMQGTVLKLSQQLLRNPIEVMVHAQHASQDNIKQTLHYVDDLKHKNRLLDHFLSERSVDYAIVFTSTKRHADQLVEELYDKGHLVAALHGDMNQRQRTRTIKQLREGRIKILVATDVAARGIDVQAISHVINFDLPNSVEDYVHRIGRTGRAGAKGTALSFVAKRDAPLVKRIEKFTGQKIDILEIAGLESRGEKSFSLKPKRPRFKPREHKGNKSQSPSANTYNKKKGFRARTKFSP